MLFHVLVEFLDSLNSIDGSKTLVAHEPVGLLLGQVTELLERGLQKVIFVQIKASSYHILDKLNSAHLYQIVI